jgi:ribosome-associated protein
MKKEFFAEQALEIKEKSRSQKKRESTALQEQGRFLAALSPAVWETLPLSRELAAALREWRGMRTREAKRRHMQYIGRLMRELDEDAQSALAAALAALGHGGLRPCPQRSA